MIEDLTRAAVGGLDNMLVGIQRLCCQHHGRTTTYEVCWHDNGMPYVVGQTLCTDCGKPVPAFNLNDDLALRMLNEARRSGLSLHDT